LNIFIFQIGRLAFSNITVLNRIQTIVYETAYHANDNLLICAPTGAGKTNVALLAMLNTIRNNMDESGMMILRDKFKVF
jgi:activating signal cointegrator complex subunit 3